MSRVVFSLNNSQKGYGNRSLTLYLACRTAVITILLGGAALFFVKGSTQQQTIIPLFILIAVAYFSALISALVLKFFPLLKYFVEVQISWDLLFVSVLILMSRGIESVFSFAYLLIIVSASFLLNRRFTLLAAACSVILFGGILDLQYFGYLKVLNLEQSFSAGTYLSVIFVHSVAFFLTAGLSGTLAERWQRSEAQLLKKSVDYADLEKMNRTILAHISSGLMLVGPKGLVRSFNRAAEEITGYDLLSVYNQSAAGLFPGFSNSLMVGAQPVRRSECFFNRPSGENLILGYATTPAWGNQGEFIGTLVTFQDLTQLKRIEEDLKRADRLAAVGRLAAGMAHEIRNPLTSISGSVQMLAESANIPDQDIGLMKIVVKEADRLNHLLTDFLDFARPKVPIKKPVNIVAVILELQNMLLSDKRFKNIEISVNKGHDEVVALLDRDMLFQILWDLAVNAMEAMNGHGTLSFGVGNKQNSDSCIVIEDSGPGISDTIKEKIFEPFFSTKESGTGLGLASVYSVMDIHDGRVMVEQSPLGGAQFVLCFCGEGRVGENKTA